MELFEIVTSHFAVLLTLTVEIDPESFRPSRRLTLSNKLYYVVTGLQNIEQTIKSEPNWMI